MKYINRDPKVCKLLNMWDDLRKTAEARANNLMQDDHTRAKARSAADTYSFCIMTLDKENL